VYQEIYVLTLQNEMLCLVIRIDKQGGEDTVLTDELYDLAGYIADFIINVNGANFYVDVLISKDHCLKINHAYPVGKGLHSGGALLRQQIQVLC
jgi:hypothetical protein